MMDGLKLKVEASGIVVTRAPEKLSDAFMNEVKEIGVPVVGIIPDDPALLDFDMEKRSLLELPDSSPSVLATDTLLEATCPA